MDAQTEFHSVFEPGRSSDMSKFAFSRGIVARICGRPESRSLLERREVPGALYTGLGVSDEYLENEIRRKVEMVEMVADGHGMARYEVSRG